MTLWTGSQLNERQSKKAVTSNDDEHKQRRISFELFFPPAEGYDVLMRTVFAFLCFVFDFVCFFFFLLTLKEPVITLPPILVSRHPLAAASHFLTFSLVEAPRP